MNINHPFITLLINLCHLNFLVLFLGQLGFMLLALIYQFDFPPFMVLIIAILNDGLYLAPKLHDIRFSFCS